MRRIAFACLCAAALAVLPACGSSGQEVGGASAASTESSSTGESSSESDTAPAAETGGTEPARPPQNNQGSLEVASLPLGANVDGDGCLTIRFQGAASEVPAYLR